VRRPLIGLTLFSRSVVATEYVISFKDNGPLGRIDAIQSLIRTHFRSVRFRRTTSGQEKLRIAIERGVEFPPALRASLESLPSLIEGVAEGPGWHVAFGLRHLNPLTELVVQPRGDHADLDAGLRAIEKALRSTFRVYGEPAAE
jgi:hypothetical protein